MREPEPVLVVDLFPVERQHLLQLLAQLREEEWHNRCKNTILSEHYARWSTYFLSWDVESTVSRFFGRDVRNDVE